MLGLDLGASGCKAGLFTAHGALLALERSAYAIERDAGPAWPLPRLLWGLHTEHACTGPADGVP